MKENSALTRRIYGTILVKCNKTQMKTLNIQRYQSIEKDIVRIPEQCEVLSLGQLDILWLHHMHIAI